MAFPYIESSHCFPIADMTIPTKTYNHSTAASALFFKNTDAKKVVHQALRVEVPEIGKEFSDNAYIGTGMTSFGWIHGANFLF